MPRPALRAANPASAAQLDQQMASLLQVDVKELPYVITNTQKATTSYNALTAQVQAGAKSPPAPTKTHGPSAAQLAAEQEFQRAGITVEGVRLLFLNLTPASWKGLHGYITGTYKTTVYKH